MDCPACKTERLAMTERQGIEIDYCPRCRGVWLDRGELDKLIERSTQELTSASQSPPPAAMQPAASDHAQGGYRGHHGERHYNKDHRRKSLWKELFD